jgi:hypothetical protein
LGASVLLGLGIGAGASTFANAADVSVAEIERLCRWIDDAEIRYADNGKPILSPELQLVLNNTKHPCHDRLVGRLQPITAAIPGPPGGYP